MKKLLSILICVVLGIANAWAANWQISPKAEVKNSVGGEVKAYSIRPNVITGSSETEWSSSTTSGTFQYGITRSESGILGTTE